MKLILLYDPQNQADIYELDSNLKLSMKRVADHSGRAV
jgi:hypothetical protein